MVSLEFVINNLPPQPRNSSHTLRKTFRGGKEISFMGKTELALMFEKDLTNRLQRLKGVKFDGFDFIEYSLVVGTPAKEFWTVKEEVSKTSIDFDAHKVFTDVVARETGFNDGSICCHHFLKVPVDSPYWFFAVSLKAVKAKGFIQTYSKESFLQTFSERGFQTL